MVLSCRMLSFLGLVLLSKTEVWAAEVIPVEDERCEAILSGDIAPGDVEKVAAVIPMWGSICLDSRGGNYLEGRKLYDYFAENGIATYVTSSSQCQSACALAFLGGSVWGDFRYSSKTIEPGAYLAFHAPFLNLPEASYSSSDMAAAVSSSVEVIKDLVEQRRILMISEWFMTEFLLFNSVETKPVVTVRDAAHAGLTLAASLQDTQTSVEDRLNACGLMFEIFEKDFDGGQAAWSPYFPKESSEFSRIQDFGEIQFGGKKWSAVVADHDFETPWLISGCGFPKEPTTSDDRGQEVLMWVIEKTGSSAGPEDAAQVMRRHAKWWYFLDSDTKLSALGK